jgi:hypothetical protein
LQQNCHPDRSVSGVEGPEVAFSPPTIPKLPMKIA